MLVTLLTKVIGGSVTVEIAVCVEIWLQLLTEVTGDGKIDELVAGVGTGMLILTEMMGGTTVEFAAGVGVGPPSSKGVTGSTGVEEPITGNEKRGILLAEVLGNSRMVVLIAWLLTFTAETGANDRLLLPRGLGSCIEALGLNAGAVI